jgi:hypothetical protein
MIDAARGQYLPLLDSLALQAYNSTHVSPDGPDTWWPNVLIFHSPALG